MYLRVFWPEGYSTGQLVIRHPLIAEERVRSLFSPCGICGEQSSDGTGFCPKTSTLPCPGHCTLDLIYLLLLPGGQTGEDCKPSKSSTLPKIRVHCIEKYFICFRL